MEHYILTIEFYFFVVGVFSKNLGQFLQHFSFWIVVKLLTH